MIFRIIGAGLIAALCTAPAAFAADLSGDPYDDPRYADIYRDNPPPPPPQDYAERSVERYGQGPRAETYDRPGGPADEYDRGGYDRGGYDRGQCLPRHLIRRELLQEGWRDFGDLAIRGEFVLLRARRPSGRLFDLKIDRCTGNVVNARPYDDDNYYGKYAYDPRRHWRY